jgi:predicted nucleic acid-binding Zn ribbon protein
MVDLDALIRHLGIEPDASAIWRTAADFKVVTREADREEDAFALARYRELRVGQRSFRPGTRSANCHAAALAQWRHEREFVAAAPVVAPTPAVRACVVCGRTLTGRPQQRTCGKRCRKALSRARKCDKPQVTGGVQTGLSDLGRVSGTAGHSRKKCDLPAGGERRE